jgi:hypothetical protein
MMKAEMNRLEVYQIPRCFAGWRMGGSPELQRWKGFIMGEIDEADHAVCFA